MTDMTFAKQAGAALLAIALLSSPALAIRPRPRRRRQGCELAVIQTAQKVTFDGKTLTLSRRQTIGGDVHRSPGASG